MTIRIAPLKILLTSSDVRQILPRSTSLPWQQNLRQKSPITRLVLDITLIILAVFDV